MSGLTASVRVRPDVQEASRPTRARLNEAAEFLKALGFDVLHVGRIALSVQADEAVFEREFGVRPQAHEALVTGVRARNPKLAEFIDLVEFAPPAEHFTG